MFLPEITDKDFEKGKGVHSGGRYKYSDLEKQSLADDIEEMKQALMKSHENLERMIASLNRRITELEWKTGTRSKEPKLFEDEERSASYGGGLR